MRKSKLTITILLLFLAVCTRFIPHAPNFTAIGSLTLLGGFWMRGKRGFVLIPLILLFMSDLVLNNLFYKGSSGFTWFYSGMGFVYAGHLAMMAWGNYIVKNPTKMSWIGHAAGANLIFFLISNFGVWFGNPSLPQDISGLFLTYSLAIPFYLSSLAGTLVYGFVMLFSLSKVLNSALVKN